MKTCIQNSFSVVLLLLACSCAVGPDYVRPVVETPAKFKESVDWKVAQPQDKIDHGRWWGMFTQADSPSESKCYHDTQLDELEAQINISNLNVIQAEAAYRQAQATVWEARTAFFPTASANYSDVRTNNPPSTTVFGFTQPGIVFNDYNAGVSANWELDVWGRIRRLVESKQSAAQASAADLEGARLSAQAELLQDYIGLRYADERKRLLSNIVTNNEKMLKLTRSLYETGIARRSDVAQAEGQLESSKAQAIDVDIQRAQFEHAIAILVGKTPASFSISPVPYVPVTPKIPAMLPSDLLQRRPDIAAAERQVAAANAQIGVAQAAFFPTFSMSASVGYQSFDFEHFSQLFSNLHRIWSIGPSVSEPIFDAGLHIAQKREAIAAYDQKVAGYRGAVLGAFKEVEDNLISIRVLEQEAIEQHASADSFHEAVGILLTQYKTGVTRYLEVMTAENSETNSELTALGTEGKRAGEAVTLVKALGGGWNAKAIQ